MSKHTGTVAITVGGKEYGLRYNYAAISTLQTKFGQDIFEKLNTLNPGQIAEITAIGCKDLTVDAVMEASPPILDMLEAIDCAFAYAYWGPEKAPQIIEQKNDIKKKLIESMTE